MSLTPSNMIPLGSKAPDFELLDVCTSKNVTLQELVSPIATVIMFICNHCPYVKYIQKALVEVARYYGEKGIAFIAINSNDVTAYPEDHPEKMKEKSKELNFSFPYLFDEEQSVAKAYKAACTPDFYIFNKNLELVYRGQFDSARPGGEIAVTGEDLKDALDQLIQKKDVNTNQKPSIGCNIKWKD